VALTLFHLSHNDTLQKRCVSLIFSFIERLSFSASIRARGYEKALPRNCPSFIPVDSVSPLGLLQPPLYPVLSSFGPRFLRRSVLPRALLRSCFLFWRIGFALLGVTLASRFFYPIPSPRPTFPFVTITYTPLNRSLLVRRAFWFCLFSLSLLISFRMSIVHSLQEVPPFFQDSVF